MRGVCVCVGGGGCGGGGCGGGGGGRDGCLAKEERKMFSKFKFH